jgi:hypothetical protein
VSSSTRLVVGFHGYGQSAEDMLSELERIPGNERWTLLSVQALHRFYSRGHERVVASWMTSQDRELAIADNLAYVDRVVGSVVAEGRLWLKRMTCRLFSSDFRRALRWLIARQSRAPIVPDALSPSAVISLPMSSLRRPNVSPQS